MLADFEDLADERVIQRSGVDGLAAQSFARDRIGSELVGHDLECNVPIEARVAPSIHGPHATTTDVTENLIRAEAVAAGQPHRQLVFVRHFCFSNEPGKREGHDVTNSTAEMGILRRSQQARRELASRLTAFMSDRRRTLLLFTDDFSWR